MSRKKMIIYTLLYQLGLGGAISIICLVLTSLFNLDDLYKIIITYIGLILSVPITIFELKKIGID